MNQRKSNKLLEKAGEKMTLKPNHVKLTFEGVAKSDKGRLIGIRPWIDYNSKAQLGFTYEILLESNGFEKIQVKVENHPPLFTGEDLSVMTEPIYLTFENFVSTFYFANKSQSFELTCKASKALIFKQTAKA
ncbi:hypothetical protein AC739_15200 [Planococcus glaciei]|uniref:hypothetical protein n=1 Tax=Planococcus glaciei TaxID=459472 RepID=UPI00069E971C|nr:hypothetical protein [Planococcus glaciei]KOF09466.1 hypothetical protein AC739_15200 [Planococcus glaciei]